MATFETTDLIAQPIGKCDLNLPALLFGGAFVVSALMGATAESTPVIPGFNEEVKVVQAENAIGYDDIDLVASCSNPEHKFDEEQCTKPAQDKRH